MKKYALISVILLVAFMWSCENKSSSPYTPEDLTTLATNSGDDTVTVAGKSGKGKGKVEKGATYTVVVDFGGPPVGSDGDARFFSANCLDASGMLLDLKVLNSPDCFTGDTYPGNFWICQNIMFRFKAKGNNYTLLMPEDNIVGTWPPSTDTTIFTGSKLQLASGKKNDCKGTVTLPFPSVWTIVVTKNK